MSEAPARRRGRGEGSLFFDVQRQRWIAEVTTGYNPRGKRIVRRGSGRTKTEARAKLKQVLRDHEDGVSVGNGHYTVGQAVTDWLAFGLSGRAPATLAKWEHLSRTHTVPDLGRRKLRDLTATDVDHWLASKSDTLSSSTIRSLHNGLSRAVRQAMSRDLVRRNVVELCDVPAGGDGRRSKSLSAEQAGALLVTARSTPMHAYVVTSLLTGVRTEELRALTWPHLDLDGDLAAGVPPSVQVWRSVRRGGDTKTSSSRRTLALPAMCVQALREHRERQQVSARAAGRPWDGDGYVFCTSSGGPLDAANVRRSFRAVVRDTGLADEWTPRELRHSFVSLLSSSGVPIERIADLVGHTSSRTTETVYRHQLRPVLLDGAVTMDALFAVPIPDGSHPVSHAVGSGDAGRDGDHGRDRGGPRWT